MFPIQWSSTASSGRVVSSTSSKPVERPDWADFRSVRDWVNREAYGGMPRVGSSYFVMGGIGFVLAIRLALYSSPTLVYQFMVGVLFLQLFKRLLESLSDRKPVNVSRLRQAFLQEELSTPLLSLASETFRMRGKPREDVSFQQNTLLILALIGLQHLAGDMSEYEPRWLLIEFAIGSTFGLMRWREENRSQVAHWLSGSRAIEACLAISQVRKESR